MTKTKLLQVIIGLLLVVNIVTLSVILIGSLRDKGPRHHMKHEGPKQRIIQKLNFSPDQINQFEAAIEIHRNGIREVDLQLRKLRSELYQSIQGDQPVDVDQKLQQINQLQNQIERIHMQHFKDIKAICKPDQLQGFESLMKESGELFHRGEEDLLFLIDGIKIIHANDFKLLNV